MKALFRTLILAGLCAPVLKAAGPEGSLRLPEGAKAAWAVAPGPALPPAARFDVDAKGGVWFLPAPRALIRADGLALALDDDARDLAFAGAKLCLATDLAAGDLKLRKRKAGVSAKLRRQLLLPSPDWRLAKGGPDGAVAFGWDPEAGRSVLVRVADRRKLLVWPERVLAADGTADAWFLATASGVERVSRQGASSRWGSLPGGVSSLAWVEGAGLAVAGPQGAALFQGPGKRLPLVSSKFARVRSRAGALYLLLPAQGGVLKITGLGVRAQ